MVAIVEKIELNPKVRLRQLLRDLASGNWSIDENELVSVGTAIERVTGRRPSPPQCVRYTNRPIGGVVLPAIRIGGRKLTSEPWVRLWVAASTYNAMPSESDMDAPSMKPGRKPKSVSAKSSPALPILPARKPSTTDAIDAALDEAGI